MMKIFTCLQCGKEFTDTKYVKIRKYCSQQCLWEARRKRVNIACKRCGVEFTLRPSEARQGIVYCSKDCRVIGMRERCYQPDKNGEYTCSICGKEFVRNKKHANRGRNGKYFCSTKCRGVWQSVLMVGPNGLAATKMNPAKPDTYEKFTCKTCGNEFYGSKHQKEYENSRGKNAFIYCSKECLALANSENHRGEKNYNWRGGVSYDRGPSWTRQASHTRKRDNYTCRYCGFYGRKKRYALDVHHIIPFRLFENPDEANMLENLVTLCRPCHSLVETGKIQSPIN